MPSTAFKLTFVILSFDAGTGADPIRNTVRLGSKGTKRFY
jgi:hypothetical protein